MVNCRWSERSEQILSHGFPLVEKRLWEDQKVFISVTHLEKTLLSFFARQQRIFMGSSWEAVCWRSSFTHVAFSHQTRPPKPQTCFRRIRQHEEREFNLLIQTYFFFYLYFISASSSLIRFNAIFKTFPPKSNPAQHRHTNDQWTLFTFLNIKCLKGENIDKKLFCNINTGLIHEYKR